MMVAMMLNSSINTMAEPKIPAALFPESSPTRRPANCWITVSATAPISVPTSHGRGLAGWFGITMNRKAIRIQLATNDRPMASSVNRKPIPGTSDQPSQSSTVREKLLPTVATPTLNTMHTSSPTKVSRLRPNSTKKFFFSAASSNSFDHITRIARLRLPTQFDPE